MKMLIKGLLASAAILATLSSAQAAQGLVSFGQGDQSIASQYVAEYVQGQHQVHVVGVYDGGTTGGTWFDARPYTTGTTLVNVLGTPEEKVSLVLTSYESTNWVIQGDGASLLDSVMIRSYNPSSVVGIDAGKVTYVDTRTIEGAPYGYALPTNDGGGNAPLMIENIETAFGVPIASFTGTYTTNPNRGLIPLEPGAPAELQVYLNFSGVAVPEPASSALWLLGAGAIALVIRRRRLD